jgi:hypothetical protein
MPPPPPQRSRSFEELRNQVESLKTQNERLRAQMDTKPQPSADEIAKRNPTRANPNPSNPEIKLEQYATDWLEEEHTNVLVDLNEDFEDYTISEHATILQNDNVSLLGMTDEKVEQVVDGYKAFSVLNVCYRLLLTLPGSLRTQAQELINTIKADDVPENTPVISEMTAHLGKTKTDNYGNIRINHQLHHAKMKIVKAISYVHNHPDFKHELSKVKDADTYNLFLGDTWKRGVFLDRDSMVYMKTEAKKYLDETSDVDFKFQIDNKHFKCSIPSLQESKYTEHGIYSPSPSFVKRYIGRIGWISDSKTRHNIAAAMLIHVIGYDFVQARTKALKDYDDLWDNTDYANTTFDQLMEYLGIIVLDDYYEMKHLKDNYSVISTRYRNLIEQKVKTVFKTVPLKKDEFGTDAQMMRNPSWTKGELPSVTSGFKISNNNHIVASGIFNFTSRVRFAISDRMYLKSPVRTVISDMINKFCRKK